MSTPIGGGKNNSQYRLERDIEAGGGYTGESSETQFESSSALQGTF